jgi:hypothetical protein
MADLTDVYSALQKADAAGDTAGAQQLADYIRSQDTATTSTYTAPPSGMDNALRQTALLGRAASQGVVNTLTLPDTVANWEVNKLKQGSNAVFGTKFDTNYPSLAQRFSQGLTSAGAYTPDTSGEQMASAVTQGVTGALTGAGALGLGGLANAARAGASGATSAGSSEVARQIGLPPWMQVGAGLVGGQVPAFLESAGQTIGNLVSPLTTSGQSRMAGMLLNEQAQDPNQAIANMQSAGPLVPGSVPTMGAASRDLGLLGVQKGLRGMNPVDFGERLSEQNTAQQTALSTMAGTPADLANAVKARSAATAPLYASAATDSAPIDNEMISLMQRPSMQAAITKAQSLSAEKGQPFGMASYSPGTPMSLSGQDLQRVKMALDDMRSTAFTQGIGSHQVGAMQDTSDALKDWMLRNVPSQRAADAAFQNLSGPINRMESLQELQQKASTTAVDLTSRQPFLSSALMSRALDKLKDNQFSGVQPADMTRLTAIQQDLQREQAVNGPLLKAPGSDTFQNFSVNQNLLGAGNIGKLSTKPLGWLYQKFGGVDKAVNEQLTNAALDPKLAASLMQKAQIPQPQFNGYPYDIGTFFGLPGVR